MRACVYKIRVHYQKVFEYFFIVLFGQLVVNINRVFGILVQHVIFSEIHSCRIYP